MFSLSARVCVCPWQLLSSAFVYMVSLMQALRRSVIKSITGRYVYGLVIALVVGLLSWSSRCEEAWGEGGNWE